MGAPQIDDTLFPIGEVSFIEAGQAVTAGEAGDSQAIQLDCVLPVNYAYTLVDINLNLSLTNDMDFDNWSPMARCSFRDTSVGGTKRKIVVFALVSAGAFGEFGGGSELIMSPFNGRIPRDLKQVPTGNPGNVNLEIFWVNDSLNGEIAFLGFSVRFMQYSIAVASHATVNTPQLVR